ncbi:MAG TPA: hypothetical protein VMB19_08910 [Silvibacterium sp.]|nr:hypothetical protein [Silvibacterium sp.]
MDRLQAWIDELRRRQDNIDPIRRIPNGALFQGALINGTLRLNRVQRFGAGGLGLLGLAFGCAGLVHLGVAFWERSSVDQWLPELIFLPLQLWFGWKMTINALVNDPKRARARKT